MSRTPRFNPGDKVRVRLASTSPYKGSVGIIKGKPLKQEGTRSYVVEAYVVEFVWEGTKRVNSFLDQDLERVDD